MNRTARITIAKELLLAAKELMAAWKGLTKDIDVSQRNVETHDSYTHFAPALNDHLREEVVKTLGDSHELGISKREMKNEWSSYLTFIDPATNKNKYHYYAVYSVTTNEGTKYIAMNTSGRIGVLERAYDLTKKFLGGPATSLDEAVRALNRHRLTKIRDGYEESGFVRK